MWYCTDCVYRPRQAARQSFSSYKWGAAGWGGIVYVYVYVWLDGLRTFALHVSKFSVCCYTIALLPCSRGWGRSHFQRQQKAWSYFVFLYHACLEANRKMLSNLFTRFYCYFVNTAVKQFINAFTFRFLLYMQYFNMNEKIDMLRKYSIFRGLRRRRKAQAASRGTSCCCPAPMPQILVGAHAHLTLSCRVICFKKSFSIRCSGV